MRREFFYQGISSVSKYSSLYVITRKVVLSCCYPSRFLAFLFHLNVHLAIVTPRQDPPDETAACASLTATEIQPVKETNKKEGELFDIRVSWWLEYGRGGHIRTFTCQI
jgi:hypothetical protein